jgi:hypothetical protein
MNPVGESGFARDPNTCVAPGSVISTSFSTPLPRSLKKPWPTDVLRISAAIANCITIPQNTTRQANSLRLLDMSHAAAQKNTIPTIARR